MEEKKKELKVIVTFKPTEKWIYDEVQKHSGKGNWIKDILAEHIRKQKKPPSDDRV